MKKSILMKNLSFILCFILCVGTVGIFSTMEVQAAKRNYTGEYWDNELRHAVEVKQLSANKVKVQFNMWYGTKDSPSEEGTDTCIVRLKNNKATFTINGTYHTAEPFKCTIVFSKNALKYKITGTSSRLSTGNKYLKLNKKYKKNFQDIISKW